MNLHKKYILWKREGYIDAFVWGSSFAAGFWITMVAMIYLF